MENHLPELDGYDSIIISDYDKGCVNTNLVSKIVNGFKGMIIVDPKGQDWSKYRGKLYNTQ